MNSEFVEQPIGRRRFLAHAAGGALAAWTAGAFAAPKAEKKPDILFIAVEDFSPHRLGCYGGPVKTPNIDRFAASALRFAQAHTNPPCCPSRTALLLGKRPETTRVFGNTDDWHKLYPNAKPLPVVLRENGYETIRCGKMYHANFEDNASWTRNINPQDGLPPVKSKRLPLSGPGADLEAEARAQGKQAKTPGGSPFSYGPSGLTDDEEKDGMVALQDDPPMALCIGQHATHLAFTAPQKYFDMYPAEEMKIPKNPDSDADGMPLDKKKLSNSNPHTIEQWKAAIAAHYATLSFVDAQIGRVLDALEETGRADNTIVVLWSDHGFMLGEHYGWRKGMLRDHSTMTMLLWRAPGVTTPGSVCDRPVEAIDIFPTLMDLCGVPIPADTEACSMKPLLEDPSRPWKKGALMWGGGGQSIVTEKWRYNEYAKGDKPAELFDRVNEPDEFVNLAADPKYKETVAELSQLIKGGWKACMPEL